MIVGAVLTLLLFVLFFVHRLITRRTRRSLRRIPTGPTGLWLLGNTLLPVESFSAAFFDWSLSSNMPVFEFRLNPTFSPFVVVNDPSLIREMFRRRDLSGRGQAWNAGMTISNPDRVGIISQSRSPAWTELHRLARSTLSGTGAARERTEAIVLEEADALVDAMLAQNGAGFEPAPLLRRAACRVVAAMILGADKEVGVASDFLDHLRTVTANSFSLSLHPVYGRFPWTTRIFETPLLKATRNSIDFLRRRVDDLLQKRRATPDDAIENPADFLSAVESERRGRTNAEPVSDDNVRHAVLDLLAAGTDTTSAALEWTLVWLLRHADLRLELLAELEEAFGFDGRPTLRYLRRLQKLRAFVDEVLRWSTVTDFGIQHAATRRGVVFYGFDVYIDQSLLPNLWACHHDPRVWNDPDEFRPGRFLDAEGRYRRHPGLMAFGYGTRRCIGESLARAEILAFVVRILQRLEIRLEEGSPTPGLRGIKPIVRVPEKYRVVVSERKTSDEENLQV